MAPPPLLLDPSPPLAELLHHLLHNNTSSTHLIICTSRADFLAQLQASLACPLPSDNHAAEAASPQHDLLTPTLLTIAASQHIKLSFITSVPALLAYLSFLPFKIAQTSTSTSAAQTRARAEVPLLLLLNPLFLHNVSSYWSAQALGRTIALAVEAAWKSRQRLIVVECEQYVRENRGGGLGAEEEGHDVVMTDVGGGDENGEITNEGEGHANQTSAWDQQIPILSPGTRTFGIGTDRSWTQKTVKVRDVVSKWCVQDTLKDV